jgi:hypothetical protein
VPRRKNHVWTITVDALPFEVLFGCNGMIWMQRKLLLYHGSSSTTGAAAAASTRTGGHEELAEQQEQRRAEHASTPYSIAERRALARLRNSVECLSLTMTPVTSESLQAVYSNYDAVSITTASNKDNDDVTPMSISEMLLPANAIRLTASLRL